jgi:serine/threonine protein kinase
MLTAHKPFEGDTAMSIIYKHAKAPIPKLPVELAMLQPLLDRLIAKRPEDRYPNAQVALRALEDALDLVEKSGLAA